MVCLACQSAGPTATATPDPSRASASAPPVSTETIAPLVTTAPTPAPTPPALALADPAKWFLDCGTHPPDNVELFGECSALRLGATDALMCRGGAPSESLRGGESVFSLRVLGVESGKVVTLLDTPIAAGPLNLRRHRDTPASFSTSSSTQCPTLRAPSRYASARLRHARACSRRTARPSSSRTAAWSRRRARHAGGTSFKAEGSFQSRAADRELLLERHGAARRPRLADGTDVGGVVLHREGDAAVSRVRPASAVDSDGGE